MKYKIPVVFLLAIAGGVTMAIGYVNPYKGSIPLSELVLQLSGSRGEFALGFSLPELVSLILRMVPDYIFEIYLGVMLYGHFCTASIYVFSRCPKRLNWYFGEILHILAVTVLFQILFLTTVIITTILRYEVLFDQAGSTLLCYHFIIHTAWLYGMTLLINLLAVLWGSNFSFLSVMGVQIVCITLLSGAEAIHQHSESALETFLNLNPVAHLVLGWQTEKLTAVKPVNISFTGPDPRWSAGIYIFMCIIVLIGGAVLVKKHDLLISNAEEGGL